MSKLKLYIAGAGAEAAKVKVLADAVQRAGAEITVEWWKPMLDSSTPHDRDLNDVDAECFAESDLEGLRRADVLWLVVPVEKVGAGCYFETGYLAGAVEFWPYKRPTIIASGDWRRSIFLRSTKRVDHRFAEHEDAIWWIRARLAEAVP